MPKHHKPSYIGYREKRFSIKLINHFYLLIYKAQKKKQKFSCFEYLNLIFSRFSPVLEYQVFKVSINICQTIVYSSVYNIKALHRSFLNSIFLVLGQELHSPKMLHIGLKGDRKTRHHKEGENFPHKSPQNMNRQSRETLSCILFCS